MSTPPFPPREHFPTAATLIADTFFVAGRNARMLLPMALCCAVPFVLVQAPLAGLAVEWMMGMPAGTFRVIVGSLSALLSSVGVQFATTAFSTFLDGANRGEAPDPVRAFAAGLARLPAASALSLALAIPGAAGVVLLTVPGVQLAGGLLLLPALLSVLAFGSTMSVAAVEGRGLFAAMKRSAALTDGYLVALSIARIAVTMLAALLTVLFRAVSDEAPGGELLMDVVALTFTAFAQGTTNFVLYHRLREAQDAAQPDTTISAFD